MHVFVVFGLKGLSP